VGIDRFMSEARALTNFTGNAVATILIGTWVKEIDGGQVERVLSGAAPFDEQTMIAGHSAVQPAVEPAPQPVPANA
ncbi:MAG TPA: C4-dicarboxylate transporter DctA, partial [Arthrobacter sp.]|nr:C4-dicarboxylate transporter DctA [Arthrobacter sp.]